MAKTVGPLLSLDAHGSLSKILTYSNKRTGQQVRKYNKPLAVPSPTQRGRRRLTEFLVAHWQSMSDATKATWEANAKASGRNLPGYQYFLREAQRDLATHHGLIAYWPCNQINANRVLDISGQNHHCDLEPTPPADAPHLVTSRSLRFGKALFSNGIDEYAKADAPIIPSAGDFYIEGWVYCLGAKAGDTDKRASPFGCAGFDVSIKGVTFRIDPTTQNLRLTLGNGTLSTNVELVEDITTVNSKLWFHIGVGYDYSETKFYRVLAGVRDAGQVREYAEAGFDFTLGRSPSLHFAESYWYGYGDEVCIYNRLPSAAEITRRYRFATS